MKETEWAREETEDGRQIIHHLVDPKFAVEIVPGTPSSNVRFIGDPWPAEPRVIMFWYMNALAYYHETLGRELPISRPFRAVSAQP